MFKRLPIAAPALALLMFAGFWSPADSGSAYDSASWIESGLEHERAGDLAGAERDFREASKVDRLFQPRWTLAGFYFRHNHPEEFWHWTKLALATGELETGALFDLCWKMTDDPEKIWTAAMPERGRVWDEYLSFLMSSGRWRAAGLAAARLASAAGRDDKAMLMNYCDLALEHSDAAGGLAVWKDLCRRGLLPFAADKVLTNGDFRAAPSGRGFDWRAPAAQGLASSFSAGEARFRLDGFQGDRVLLLEQPLALDAASKYRLNFEYRSTGVNGVAWQAGAVSSISLAPSEWTRGAFEFGGDAASLALVYQRPSGSTMADGSLSLRHIELQQR